MSTYYTFVVNPFHFLDKSVQLKRVNIVVAVVVIVAVVVVVVVVVYATIIGTMSRVYDEWSWVPLCTGFLLLNSVQYNCKH